jgi:hypothetical protein
MSFRDELVKKVISTRELIKQNAVNNFVGVLKSSMIKCAEEGKTCGSINLDIETEPEFDEDDCGEDVYLVLQNLLFEMQDVRTFVDDKRRYTYRWLIEEVEKTNIFADIEINLDSDDNILEFRWFL